MLKYAALLLLSSNALAADLHHQVRLIDSIGNPVNGEHPVVVELVDDATPGADVSCHTENLTNVPFEDGYATIALTDVTTPCLQGDRWLSFSVNGEELLPRHALASVPRAATAEHVAGYVDLVVASDLSAGGPCTPTGRLAYETGTGVHVCVDGTWTGLANTGPNGSVAQQAAETCATLHSHHPTLPSGPYWIDPDGDGNTADAWRAWCDMTRDGGGWTLVMQNVQSVTPNPTPTYAASTTGITLVGSMSSGLGGFDLIVGLSEWAAIGTTGRFEVGTSVGVPSQQTMYSGLTLESPNYTLTMTGQAITIGTTAPGIYVGHNNSEWSTKDVDNDDNSGSCSNSYGDHAWWYTSCWSGSIWGHNTTQGARWTSSGNGSDVAWGALWLR